MPSNSLSVFLSWKSTPKEHTSSQAGSPVLMIVVVCGWAECGEMSVQLTAISDVCGWGIQPPPAGCWYCWYLIRQTIAADTGDTRGYTGHPANVAQDDTNIDLWWIKKVCVLHNLCEMFVDVRVYHFPVQTQISCKICISSFGNHPCPRWQLLRAGLCRLAAGLFI